MSQATKRRTRRPPKTECPPPHLLRQLAAEPNPSWQSLLAWAMLAMEPEPILDDDGQPTGRWHCDYVKGEHLVLIAKKLLDLFHGRINRLAISLPPRHGKSQIVSRLLAPWWIGQRPKSKVVLCSYSLDLTREFSAVARDFLAKHGAETWGVDTTTRAAVTSWNAYNRDGTTSGGGLRAVGWKGGITGRDVDLLVVDDVFKNAEEASNPTHRQKIWDWFESVLNTRMEPWSCAIVMGTRWHHDDLQGRIEKKQSRGELGEPWEILNIPAVADGKIDDPLAREIGEFLWPGRFGKRYYENKIKDVGPYVWSALYQGEPTPSEGGMFKRDRFRYAQLDTHTVTPRNPESLELEEPEIVRELVTYGVSDLAVSTKRRSDFSAFGVFGADLRRARLYLLNARRGRMESPEILEVMSETTKHWRLPGLYVEKTAYNTQLIDLAIAQGIPVIELTAHTDKVTRAAPAQALMEQGRIYFVEGESWLPDLETELLQFPNGEHDDLADVLSYGVRIFLDLLQLTAGQSEGDDLPDTLL